MLTYISMREVHFYTLKNGKSPVAEFLDSLNSQQAQKIAWVLQLIEELEVMSDLQKYVDLRKKRDAAFANGYDEGYETFKFGVLLKAARKEAGLTQSELAEKLQTQKSAISRIENNSEDVKLSTLERFASALGKKLEIRLI